MVHFSILPGHLDEPTKSFDRNRHYLKFPKISLNEKEVYQRIFEKTRSIAPTDLFEKWQGNEYMLELYLVRLSHG